MAKFRDRLTAAWRALVTESPGLEAYAQATVRAHEEGSRLSRYRQTKANELVVRFYKYVAVAASRQATGVASAQLRVYMRKEPGRKTWWDTRSVGRKELLRQKKTGGFIARKAADYADDLEEVIDPLHPLVKILTAANPLMNGYVLRERCQFDLSLTGNAYWHVVADNEGTPKELWPLPPQYTRPVPSREVVISEYVYGRGQENERVIPAAEIIPFIQTNPLGDPYMGFGDLAKCIDDADLSAAFSQFRLNMIDNGAQPGLIVVDKRGGKEQREQLEMQLNQKFGGARNAGRTMVFSGDLEVKPNSMTEKEVAFLASDDAVKETIANCFDIPMALLTLDSAALATAKAATPQFQEFCLLPRCRRIEDVLNERLVPMFNDERLHVCFDDVVTKDYEEMAVRIVSLKGSRIITQNEARGELGYEAVPGGDDFDAEPTGLDGMGNEPVLDRGGDAEDDADGGEDEPEDPKDDDKPTKATRRPATPALLSQRAVMFGHSSVGCCGQLHHKAADEFISMTEKELEATVRFWFNQLVPKLAPEITAAGISAAAGEIIEKTFTDAVRAPIQGVYMRGWNYGVGELGENRGAVSFADAIAGPVQKYFKEAEGNLVKSVTETVDTTIREQLSEGVTAGESVRELTTRLRDSVDGMSGVKAEAIARTETAKAFNTARDDAWVESGVVEEKRWMLAPDACSFCVQVAKKDVPVGGLFAAKGSRITDSFGNVMKLDYSDVAVPPLHPSCRCTVVAVRR